MIFQHHLKMRWTCNLNGQPEPDAYGLSETADDAIKRCLRRGQVVTNLQIFSYDPKSALTLAPSDRVEVAYMISGVRVPTDKSWVFLKLCIIGLEACKKMGTWSLESWVELLVSIPTAESFRELISMREDFVTEIAHAASVVLFCNNFLKSPFSDFGAIEAIAEQHTEAAQQLTIDLYNAKSPSILKRLVVDADTSEERMEAICISILIQLQDSNEELQRYNLRVTNLLQAVIDFGSPILRQDLIDRLTQKWFSYYIAHGNGDSRPKEISIVLEWLCPLLDFYPTDRLYVDFPGEPREELDWREVASEQLITLFGKGSLQQFNRANVENDTLKRDAIRVRVIESVELLLFFDEYIEAVSPIIVDYTPSLEAIASIFRRGDLYTPLLKRASLNDIISVVQRNDLLTDREKLRSSWDRILEGYNRDDIRRIKRAVCDSLPPNNNALSLSPWTGKMRGSAQ